MELQCWIELVILFALFFAGPSVAANVGRAPTTTSACTDVETSFVVTTVISTETAQAQITTAETETVTKYLTTFTVHITPLSNGTTLTSSEGLGVTASVPDRKRAVTTSAVPFTTSRYLNSSQAVTPTTTEPDTGCRTTTSIGTLTLTEISTVSLPGFTTVITITETMLTASTLSITHPEPATFHPTTSETSSSSTVMLNPQPTPTETSTKDTVPIRPTNEPGTPGSPTRKSITPNLPQNTSPGLSDPTASGPVRRPSSGPGLPPNALPTSPVGSPASTINLFPGEIQTTTLPGIGPIVIDPSRSAVFISGVVSAITPGQQTTINDVPISFDTSATFVVIDGTQTIGIPPSTPAPQPAPVVIGGTTIDIGYIVTGLDPGEVTTVNGIPVSLDASASNVVVGDTRTIPLLEVTQMPVASMVVVGETTLDVGELASELVPGEVTVIGTMKVSRDSSAIVAGTTTISLPPSPSDVVVGGMTITAGALPFGYSFIPATAGGGLLLPNGQILMPGAMTTISGVEISLTPAETPVVVVEGSISITSTSTVGSTSGGFDNGGTLGTGQPTSTSTGDLTQFTGGAVAATRGSHNMLWISAIVSMLFGIACSSI
ncbi:hypothetical protein AG0111_0g12743 [Alternaria gaisen]|uniref:Uncharacterized protein n=1 Tax=Alternaria gaisen TaxID=167740 RepID=A0ACB6F3B1_9PLEO|nr:hypothetical protein AG0111_0g12743 [Alternaria gaisen]